MNVQKSLLFKTFFSVFEEFVLFGSELLSVCHFIYHFNIQVQK